MTQRDFILIAPTTMEPCTAEGSAPDWLCPDCHAPNPGILGVDLRIQGKTPGTASLNFAYGMGVPIARKSHLFRLGSDLIGKYLYVGSVTNESGRVLADWVTWRARNKVVVRGDQRAGHRACRVCSRDIYLAFGKQYLYPAPPPGIEIMQARYSLIVTPSIAQLLKVSDWKGVAVTALPVLEQPLDSLPAYENPAC